MAEQIKLNTVLIVRNDNTTAWEDERSYKLEKGELGIGYLPNGNVIVKSGVDGNTTWANCPQVEGVFENDLTLTYDFGRHKTSNGFVEVAAKGMTTTEWLKDALSEVREPAITQPKIEASASVVGGGEMGAYVTGVKWEGKFTDGSYEFGSEENKDSTATGLAAGDVAWAISNSIDNQTAATEDGTFTFTSTNYPQINTESSKTYAVVTAKYTLDATDARTPLNNVGKGTEGKIASITTQVELAANANATGYRKPFWGIKAAADAIDPANITSEQVRKLGKSGSSTKGLPTTTAASPYVVAAGSQQVFFLAKAGTYSSLTATDAAAMNAGVTFTKVANAVNVEGANGYTAVAYDMWYVDWGAGIDADKKLVLTWK